MMNEKDMNLFLNKTLANYFVLYIKLHRYTWFAEVPHLFYLQNLFIDMSYDIKNDIDMIAEHILAMDGIPFATMAKFLKEASIEEATADNEEEEMIETLKSNVIQLIEEIDEYGLKVANKVNDYMTEHLLIQLQTSLRHYKVKFQAYIGR